MIVGYILARTLSEVDLTDSSLAVENWVDASLEGEILVGKSLVDDSSLTEDDMSRHAMIASMPLENKLFEIVRTERCPNR